MIFGTGLVKTAEDFGAQGEQPSHPELMDWLAVEFMTPSPAPAGTGARVNWSVRDLLRLLVTSATYRQAARVAVNELKPLVAGPEALLAALDHAEGVVQAYVPPGDGKEVTRGSPAADSQVQHAGALQPWAESFEEGRFAGAQLAAGV